MLDLSFQLQLNLEEFLSLKLILLFELLFQIIELLLILFLDMLDLFIVLVFELFNFLTV